MMQMDWHYSDGKTSFGPDVNSLPWITERYYRISADAISSKMQIIDLTRNGNINHVRSHLPFAVDELLSVSENNQSDGWRQTCGNTTLSPKHRKLHEQHVIAEYRKSEVKTVISLFRPVNE